MSGLYVHAVVVLSCLVGVLWLGDRKVCVLAQPVWHQTDFAALLHHNSMRDFGLHTKYVIPIAHCLYSIVDGLASAAGRNEIERERRKI